MNSYLIKKSLSNGKTSETLSVESDHFVSRSGQFSSLSPLWGPHETSGKHPLMVMFNRQSERFSLPQHMILHDITWYYMILHDITWYYMILHVQWHPKMPSVHRCFHQSVTPSKLSEETNGKRNTNHNPLGVKVLVRTQEMAGIPGSPSTELPVCSSKMAHKMNPS